MILHDVDSRRAQALQIFAAHFFCSFGIEHGVYLDASLRSLRQRLGKLFCDFAINKGVGLKINGTFGRANVGGA